MPLMARAEKTEIQDLDRRYEYYHATYKANEDYTHEEQHDMAVTVLKERAIEDLKSKTVSYSTSVQKLEILEAYTRKADGSRIDSPKTNYQVRTDSGRDEYSPVFSDRSRITTVFPEVQVGDTVVFSYKIIQTEPMFPGYFAEAGSFSEATAYDDVHVKIITPASFPGKYRARKMLEKITKTDEQVIYEWRWKNATPTRDSRRNYSVWDPETNPGFAYTTFDSYQAIAEAYGKRALPKVVVDDPVIQLAGEIVGEETDSRKQIRLLYEWVSKNISYAGNCVGVGAVVPHDISFVLENRMGDCKDHATLLQALLASRGIKSTQALINSGSIYRLPSIPSVNSINHVINYLPDYDLFLDSTSSSTPFGMLPRSIQDKPVLLVEGFQEGKKTPVAPVGSDRQTLDSKVTIDEAGSATGEIVVSLFGYPAVMTRELWRDVSKEAEDDWLKELFSNNGIPGSGTIEKDDPKPLLDKFSYKVDFEMKEYVQTEGAGGLYIYSLFPASFSIGAITDVGDEPEENVEIACSSGFSQENYQLVFPENIKILDIPNNSHLEGSYLSYTSTYTMSGNTLSISRTLDDRTPGNICKPELVKAQREILMKINRDLRAQVVYKPIIAN